MWKISIIWITSGTFFLNIFLISKSVGIFILWKSISKKQLKNNNNKRASGYLAEKGMNIYSNLEKMLQMIRTCFTPLSWTLFVWLVSLMGAWQGRIWGFHLAVLRISLFLALCSGLIQGFWTDCVWFQGSSHFQLLVWQIPSFLHYFSGHCSWRF